MPEPATRVADAAAAGCGPTLRRHDVSLHFLGSGGVLFDAAARKLYAANTTATFIWCCLEEGLAPAGVAARLRRTFGLSVAAADEAVAAALGAWRGIGLLGGAAPGEDDSRAPPPLEFGAPAAAPDRRRYRLLDTAFRLRCAPAGLWRRVAPMLAPLVDDTDAGPALDLDLTSRDGRFALASGALVLDECRAPDEIVPMLKAQLNLLALRHSHDFAAVHAAAVSFGGRCVLMPAASGAGKSTLAAALAAAGARVMGDDTIVLADPRLEARAMPFGICLKRGSWDLLAGRFRALARRPGYRRPDGKVVRYLLPRDGGAWASPAFRQPVGWIVFLRRAAGAAAELRELPKLDAAARLLRGFYPLGAGLDASRVDRFVTWLDGTECLELRYATLEGAVARIRGLACR